MFPLKTSYDFIALVIILLGSYLIYRIVLNFFGEHKKNISYVFLSTLYPPLALYGGVCLLYVFLKQSEDCLVYMERLEKFFNGKLEKLSHWALFLGILASLGSAIKGLWQQGNFPKRRPAREQAGLASGMVKKRLIRVVIRGWYGLLFFSFLFMLLHFSQANNKQLNYLHHLMSISLLWLGVLFVCYTVYLLGKHYTRAYLVKTIPIHVIVLKAMYWPFILFLLGGVILHTCEKIYGLLSNEFQPSLFHIPQVKPIDLFFVLSIWFFYRMTNLLEEQFLLGRFTDVLPNKTIVQGSGNFARIFLGIITAIMLLGRIWDSKIWAALGGSSFVILVAGKDVIANYLSGLVIYFEGQFRVGDWIYSTDKQIEGIIEYIGIRTTWIRTFDKRVLYVPNSFFSSRSIVNASRMTHRRIHQRIPVGWITDMETLDTIVQEIRAVVYNHPGIDKTQPLMVHFTGFNTTGLEITIYALTRTRNWHTSLNVQENILKESKRIIEKHAGHPPMHVLAVKKESGSPSFKHPLN